MSERIILELKVGETFTTTEGTFEVVQERNGLCTGCFFKDMDGSRCIKDDIPVCDAAFRVDEKSVIFKKIK